VTEAWIIDAVRTPRGIGKPGKGALAGIHPQRLLATVLAAVQQRTGLASRDVDDVIAGCNTQSGLQSLCIARAAALDAGYDTLAPGVTLDRFCGSGVTAIGLGAMGIMAGLQHLIVAGGVESMSHNQTLTRNLNFDLGNRHLRALHPQLHQGVCADLIATRMGLERGNLEALAVESQRRAAVAIAEGRFARSLVPVHHDDGRLALDHDEYPRPQTTPAALAQLAPAFSGVAERRIDEDGTTYGMLLARADPGGEIRYLHTAGTSSGIVDGAAALVLASPEYARAHGLKPRARIRATVTVGDDPVLMLNGPVPAARKALAQAGMGLGDIDLFEVNEAFAVVPLKFMRDLDVDPARVNANGGAIALGHPIGATGAMLVGTLLDELERRDLGVGLVTMCTAGGMAPAMILERL
jgi:acetyl-CoA C-acetyltransferase